VAALFQVVMILRSAACTSGGMIAVHYILRRSMPSQPGLMIACPGIPPFQRLGNPGEDQRIGHSLEIVCRFGGSWEARVGDVPVSRSFASRMDHTPLQHGAVQHSSHLHEQVDKSCRAVKCTGFNCSSPIEPRKLRTNTRGTIPARQDACKRSKKMKIVREPRSKYAYTSQNPNRTKGNPSPITGEDLRSTTRARSCRSCSG